MQIKISLLLMILLSALGIHAQEKKWTLQECLEYALENNITVKQSELNVQASDLDTKDAFGNFLPTLNASASNFWSSGLSLNPVTGSNENLTFRNSRYALNAGLNIFDGLRNIRQFQRAKLNKILAQYNLGKSKDDIALFIANGYLQILLNRESLTVIEKQHEITLEQLKRTQELVDAGVLPQGDMLEIEATSADELTRIVQAENAVQISLISLAQALLIKNYEDFAIADQEYLVPGSEVMDQPINEVIAKARESRYEVQIAEQNRLIAGKDLQIARGAYYPNLNAGFNYDTRESGANPTRFTKQLYVNDGLSYGLSLNVPLFNGFSVRNNVKRSKVNVKRTEYQLEQAELDLDSNVYQAYLDAKGAAEAYEASLVSVKAQERAYAYAKDRYDVGLTNAFDFSQSKFRLENAQSQEVRNRFDYIFKLKVLELFFGVKVADMKL